MKSCPTKLPTAKSRPVKSRNAKSKLAVLFLASLALTAAAYPQARGGYGAGAPAAAPDASTNLPGADSAQPKPGDYLLGKVTVSGGDLPWDPIPVTVTCSGKTAYTIGTDPKGHFVIAPAKGATIDASSATSTSAPADTNAKSKLAPFMGCTVEAALPGFNSTALTIASRNLKDNPDLGTITLKPEDASAGTAVSSTTAAAPKDATKAFDKARSEWLDKKPERAQKDLEKAVQLDPQFAEAWYQLGKIQEAANSPDATTSFSKATAADPKFSPPYEQLATISIKASKWQDAADATDHALQLNPRGTPQLWYFNALANYKLSKPDIAEAAATKALAMDPLHTVPNSEQLLAVLLAEKHDYAAALDHLRNLLTYLPPGPNADLIKKQVDQLQQAVSSK
jgi:tetratricopeptide (TPR) repeat protein